MWDSHFWRKVWRALQRLLGAGILLLAHKAVEEVLSWAFRQYPTAHHFASVIALVIFLVVYAILLFEALMVFIARDEKE